jgi:UDP-glucose 4-epimerase
MTINLNNYYLNKKVLITGGLGFIGSNLSIKLVKLGAKVTIVDSLIPEYGGNLFNIKPIKDKIHVNYCDITDRNAVNWVVQGQDYIFHLAGQVSHILSFSDPYKDVDYNITGTLILLEACRQYNQNAKIIYTGTRGQYGPTTKLPVNEETSSNPSGVYEITNLTAEKILLVYNHHHEIKSILTRLTNVYGPRA